MMKRGTIVLALFAFLTWITLITPRNGFAHREITNQSGKPVHVMDLKDETGKPFAGLYMTGEKMSIDHYQYPEAGAGYYKGLNGQFYYIPFTGEGGLGGLHVDKIEWDDTGKTIAVKGLRPYFDGAEQIQITSDISNPKIEDGILYLQLKKNNIKEYKFTIRYGLGVSIVPSLYE